VFGWSPVIVALAVCEYPAVVPRYDADAKRNGHDVAYITRPVMGSFVLHVTVAVLEVVATTGLPMSGA